jgi:hypothetical protein
LWLKQKLIDLEQKYLFFHSVPCTFAGRNKTYNHTSNMKQDAEQTGEIVMYQPDETIRLEVRMDHETVWLNRQQMAALFVRDIKTIGKHINNALREELRNLSTVAKFAIVQPEGKRMISRDDEVYHIGASIKDLGKKWFAFTLMHDIKAAELINKMS